MLRRTKIIATLGPATDQPGVLASLLQNGLDLVRLNFSHGSIEAQQKRFHKVRRLSQKIQKEIGIIVDLQGAKVRIGRFENGPIQIQKDQAFYIDCQNTQPGTTQGVGVDYPSLYKDVKKGSVLVLNDGLLSLEVQTIKGKKIHCTALNNGTLSDNKGINLLGGGLSIDTLTAKDQNDIKYAAELGADYIAISFPKTAEDINQIRDIVTKLGADCHLIAKIERHEALDHLDEIIKTSDAIMVARGDLAIELGNAEIPWVQKHIIAQAQEHMKPTIIATQMMESMITNAQPTRAEVSDVANAVLDGCDAVMLSGETAVGINPPAVLQAVDKACIAIESKHQKARSTDFFQHRIKQIDQAIAFSTVYASEQLGIKAIVALTESGTTIKWMACIKTGTPIYGLSPHEATRRRLSLFQNVYPVRFEIKKTQWHRLSHIVSQALLAQNLVQKGDLIAITQGHQPGIKGGTNSLKIIQIT